MNSAQQAQCSIFGILRVKGVDLDATAEKLKMRLHEREGVLQADVNCFAGKIYIEYDPSRVSWEELRTLVGITTGQFDESKVISVSQGEN